MNDVTPDNASFFNLPDATGAIVSQVTPDSPASRAGLKSGDVLRELNGKKIVNGSALQVAVSEIAPGNTIALGILRDGKPETINVTVGEFHGDNRSRGEQRLGIEASAESSASPSTTSRRISARNSTSHRRSTARPSKAFAPPARQTMPASLPATSSSKSTAIPSRMRTTS